MSAETHADSPLLVTTPAAWARLAAAELDVFLSDHAVCEQQAAVSALALVSQYPEDEELVERMTALAAEELSHLRRVLALLRRRGRPLARRRPNSWVRSLRQRMETRSETLLKVDRLLVAALIEARSAERFTRLAEVLEDQAVCALLEDLGPAEERHWRLFHGLAARELAPGPFGERWQHWLETEAELAALTGVAPTVHG